MNIEDFREYCLSLSGTTEKMPFQKFKAPRGVLVFHVSGKMYCLIDIARFDGCTVKCQPERVEELKDRYNGITDPYNMTHRCWIGITLGSDGEDSMIKKLIKNS